MIRKRVALAVIVAGLGIWSPVPFPARAAGAVTSTAITFRVYDPAASVLVYTVKATLFRPASDASCTRTVVLAVHGASTGSYLWDFPVDPATYSSARRFAAAGYPVVTIDRIGYRPSDRPNGRLLTPESAAHMIGQISGHLRRGSYGAPPADRPSYERVVFMGHSTGAELVELAAGAFARADGLIAGAYTHTPSDRMLAQATRPDTLTGEYVGLAADADERRRLLFRDRVVDEDVLATEASLSNLVPSAELSSVARQPSRAVMGRITAPVLVITAENDVLFPAKNSSAELSLFSGTDDRTLHVVPVAGHLYQLHRNAPETDDKIIRWMQARASMPACAA